MARLTALLLLTIGLPLAAGAEDRFRHGRIRHVDGGVTIQRATETGAEEAVPNLPLLPGDRVWTDGYGRAEFQFAGGSLIRLDSGSKLDYVTHDGGRRDRVVLRLWSGGLHLHGRNGAFEVETPGGVVTADDKTVLRVDATPGETRLSVYEGEASLDDTEVDEGERVYARDGGVSGPSGFDRAETDNFDLWVGEQHTRMAASRERRLDDEELAIYEDELESHGAWAMEVGIGNVWRPHVSVGWRPYENGRWAWTAYGWTWIPYEPWGWATSHYGRWGYSPAGWYWMPSAGWGPAWVSWARGGDYVGWCPLGYGNRPVVIHQTIINQTIINNGRGRGRAVLRDGAPTWTYARAGDLTARDLPRRRVDSLDHAVARELRVIENPRTARLTRDLAVATGPAPAVTPATEARALPRRSVRTKPTMADTVPELRNDPMTTIPIPTQRVRRTAEEEKVPPAGEGGETVRSFPRRPATRISNNEDAQPTVLHPTDTRGSVVAMDADGEKPRRRRAPESPEPAPRPDRAERERDRERDAARERERANPEREVLRPLFRPLGKPREGDAGSASPRRERERERNEPRRERPEPPRAEPKSPPPTTPASDGGSQSRAVRRGKPRDE